ncbi:hypothetical protein T492DRAFT_843763 [Pavlovales sp. CCMP2436]|nr:hypothetical protein T492DRAFT_843763 [Pavlovales sp. CCMP2436]
MFRALHVSDKEKAKHAAGKAWSSAQGARARPAKTKAWNHDVEQDGWYMSHEALRLDFTDTLFALKRALRRVVEDPGDAHLVNARYDPHAALAYASRAAPRARRGHHRRSGSGVRLHPRQELPQFEIEYATLIDELKNLTLRSGHPLTARAAGLSRKGICA